MPLAGRLADLWGARRLFLGALVVFIVGSALAGAAQDLDQLIARPSRPGGRRRRPRAGRDGRGRATCTTATRRPRALGVIGALTFLGHGRRAVPRRGDPGRRSIRRTRWSRPGSAAAAVASSAPAWRWVFYVNVPIGLVALALGWAASRRLGHARRPGRVDVLGAIALRRRAGRRARRA